MGDGEGEWGGMVGVGVWSGEGVGGECWSGVD